MAFICLTEYLQPPCHTEMLCTDISFSEGFVTSVHVVYKSSALRISTNLFKGQTRGLSEGLGQLRAWRGKERTRPEIIFLFS